MAWGDLMIVFSWIEETNLTSARVCLEWGSPLTDSFYKIIRIGIKKLNSVLMNFV